MLLLSSYSLPPGELPNFNGILEIVWQWISTISGVNSSSRSSEVPVWKVVNFCRRFILAVVRSMRASSSSRIGSSSNRLRYWISRSLMICSSWASSIVRGGSASLDSLLCILMLFSPGEHSKLLNCMFSSTAELAAVVAPVVEDIFVYIAVA